MAHPFVSRAEFQRIKSMAAKKRARRLEKRAENAALVHRSDKPSNASRVKNPRRPTNTRKRLVGKLDALFSIFVRLRGKKITGGACELCLKRPIEVCFHWVSRGDYATRWSPDNAVASCRGCNFEETFRKRKYRDLHISRIGRESREALEDRSRVLTHLTDADLEAKLDELKTELG